MERRLFLIGTRHTAQKGLLAAPEAEYQQFRSLLDQAISALAIQTIGEEMSQDALGRTAFSVARRAAEHVKINHVFCDPDRSERRALHILEHNTSAREIEWFRRLQSAEFPVLFICGATHVATFAAICRDARINVTVLHADWEPKTGAPTNHTIL